MSLLGSTHKWYKLNSSPAPWQKRGGKKKQKTKKAKLQHWIEFANYTSFHSNYSKTFKKIIIILHEGRKFQQYRSHIFWTSCFAHRTKATIERLKHHVSMSFDWQNRVLASRRSSRSCHVWKQQKRQQQQQQTSVHHFERWRIDIKSRASSLCYLSLISPPPLRVWPKQWLRASFIPSLRMNSSAAALSSPFKNNDAPNKALNLRALSHWCRNEHHMPPPLFCMFLFQIKEKKKKKKNVDCVHVRM